MCIFYLLHFIIESLYIISLSTKRTLISHLEHLFAYFSLTFYKYLLNRYFAASEEEWLNKVHSLLLSSPSYINDAREKYIYYNVE